MDTPTPNTTRDQLLAHAEKLIRTRGCNGFSYRDLAEHVGVKTSSIHYYFPGKDDLLYEAVEAYSARALASVRSIDTAQPAHAQLDAYLSMMESKACGHGELCLGGMLAAEMMSLPDRVRGALQGFPRARSLVGPCAGARRRRRHPEVLGQRRSGRPGGVRHGAGLHAGVAPVPGAAGVVRGDQRLVRRVPG